VPIQGTPFFIDVACCRFCRYR